jgi:hypothetical protein
MLWKSHGNSVRRHAAKSSQHSRCNVSCPCYTYLGLKPSHKGARLPTVDELCFIMDIDEQHEAIKDDSDVDNHAHTPYDLVDPPSESRQIRPLRVMYVPDPTLAVSTPSAAKNDLAFIHASITSHEYESIRLLKGSVYTHGSKVVLQEWVRIVYDMSFVVLTDCIRVSSSYIWPS